MVQEVQQQWNWYQTPDRIIWVWFSERWMNDYTQIRNKRTSEVIFKSGNITCGTGLGEVKATSWTYTTDNDRYYKVHWWDIYISLAWAYQIEFVPYTWINGGYTYTTKIYVDGKLIFNHDQTTADYNSILIPLNLGKRNKITASYEWYSSYNLTMPITLKITQL